MTTKGVAQITICDLNDITTSNTAPDNPSIGQLWMDTSGSISVLRRWTGTIWDKTGASSLAELDPGTAEIIEDHTLKIQANVDNIELISQDLTSVKNSSGLSTFSDIGAKIKLASDGIDNKVWNVDIENSVAIDKFQNGDKIFNNVLNVNSLPVTGALVIETPIPMDNYMTRIDISGYNYLGGATDIDCSISFYGYHTGPLFYQYGYTSKGSFDITRVRLALNTNNRIVIIIGDTTTNWQHPKIYINKVTIGLTTPPDTFKTGWIGSFKTDVITGYHLITELTHKKIVESTDGAQAKVNDLNDNIIVPLETRINSAESSITQHTNDIEARVTTSVYNSKMNSLDGSIASMDSRLDNAELKITDNAIINTVSAATKTSINDSLAGQNLSIGFTKIIGGTFNGNNFTKTTSTSWTSGFSSTKTLTNGEYVEYTISALDSQMMIGLSNTDTDAGYVSLKYAIYQAGQNILAVYESGYNKTTFSTAAAIGDKLRISIEDNKICYYHNGKLVYTSLTTPTLPLIVDTSLYTYNSTMSNIKVGTMLSGIATRMASAETKLTDNSYTIQIQNNANRMYKIRYIRDWCGEGWGVSAGDHRYSSWRELMAINSKGVNLAKGKAVTGETGLQTSTYATDGIVYSDTIQNPFAQYTDYGLHYIKVDLGVIYENIDTIRVWHDSSCTFFGTKTEVSSDGVNWITVYDSATTGTYSEATEGHTIKMNNYAFTHTMTGDFTDDGLTIQAGALRVVDETDRSDTVFVVSDDSLNNPGIELGSRKVGTTPYIDFHSTAHDNDHDARILCIGGGVGDNLATIEVQAKDMNVKGNLFENSRRVITSGTVASFAVGHRADTSTYLNVDTTTIGAYGITWWQSDMMLKTNFNYTNENALDKILSIEHASYDWKDQNRQHQKLGVLSDQLELIEPSWVIHVPQKDGSYIIQPVVHEIIPYITKAMQEQQTIIEDLKKRIEILESVK